MQSDKDKLHDWILKFFPNHVKTSDIIKWGTIHFSNTADRIKRRLVEEGKLRKLSNAEKTLSGFDTIEGVYEVIR